MKTSDTTLTRTLARLSFWVPPERMAEFEVAYEAEVAPILKKHGLTESSERGRATVAGVFNRLFELKTPSEVTEEREALEKDLAWQETLRELGAAFGSDGSIQYHFELYSVPVGSGKVVPAGPGRVVVPGGGRGHWRTYDSTNGLAGGHVLSMLQDQEGHLWFGTNNGLNRYDGHGFTNFTTADGLVNNWVWSIFQDREGNLWFGTKGGASRYNGKAFTAFTTQDGLANNEVKSIFQDREGHLWFGTSRGVSRYDGKAFTTFTSRDGLASNSVSSVFQTSDGDLWFGTGKFGPASGVSRYDGKAFTTFTTQDGLADNDVKSIFQDREGRLWFATPGGASRYDREGRLSGEPSGRGTFTTFTTRDGLANNDVLSVFQDREGHLWFTTHGGVSRYDGQDWTTFTIADGLVANLVWSILQDQEGGFWFCTSGGVSWYDDQTLIAFTPEDGLPDNVFWILQDREKNLWFSSQGGGVSRYDGKKLTIFTTRDGLSDNVVQPIFQDREGHLWFGTINGLSRYDGQTFTTFTTQDGLADNHVQGIFQDKDGVLWVGTVRGLNRYDGQTFTTFTTQDGLGANYVWSIFQDRDGVLWFGTTFGGVIRYDGQSFITFTAKDGLVHEAVISVFQDREGYLWFGTYGGVSRYDGKGFTNFTTQDGLAADGVRSILQDQEGHLWFGTTGGGVSRFDGQAFQTLTRQDGLTGNVVYAIFQDPEGDLWFGATGGVTRYRPSASSPPPVVVDAVVADRRYEGVAEVEVPSAVRLTAFEFHGMSLKTRPDAMVYRYRLKGYEEDWKNTRERRVEYQDLPIGDYTFEVVAVDRDLVYSEKPATVRLTVVRDPRDEQIDELERRVRERTRALEEANKKLFQTNLELEEANRQVQEATERKSRFLASMSHELRTPMNAIMGFTNLVLRRSGDVLPERQRENLVKVQQASNHLLNLINDILDLSKIEAGRVDVKPVTFNVKALIAGCCATVSPLVRPGVALNHEVADDVGEAHTDEARLRQVVINLLSNALKFTEKGEVKVQVSGVGDQQRSNVQTFKRSNVEEDGLLEIAVSDTGVGIPADALGYIFEEFRQVEGSHQRQKGTGLGLSITKKLTELLGGTIGVESEVGKGSTFTIRVPLVYKEKQGKDTGRGD